MSRGKSKARELQAAYRQRIKDSGGFYIGLYAKAETAHLLKLARTKEQKSYADLIAQAVSQTFKSDQLPKKKTETVITEDQWEDL